MATKTSSCSSSLSLFSSPLTIDQLIDVLNLLKRCGFPQTRWYELGLRLGLHKNTLDAMEVTLRGDVSRCLTECLSQWLSRADNVDSRGGATFDSLSDALKSMNENAAADKLDQEKRNAMISGNDINGTNDVHSTATVSLFKTLPPKPTTRSQSHFLSSSLKPMEGSISSEYITMKEMLADLVDLLAGNAPVISQLNNHLFSSDLIPKAVHVTVETTGLTPYDRSNKLFSSVLATLECHSNPNSVFSSLITALQKVGMNNMASKLMQNLRMKGGHVDPSLEEQPSVSKGPLQPVDVTAQSHTPKYSKTTNRSTLPPALTLNISTSSSSSTASISQTRRETGEGITYCSDIAHAVITENTSSIKDCRIDLHSLVDKLLEHRIINPREKRDIVDGYTRQTASERLDELLDIVSSSIKMDGEVFGIFLDILRKEGTRRAIALADKLMEKYTSLK